jgi:hypothetical protein
VYKKLAIALSAVLLVAISCSVVFARPQKSPLTKMEVLALAAGGWRKSAPRHAPLVSMAEKLFAADSPYLVQDLNGEARALPQLGRKEEAA